MSERKSLHLSSTQGERTLKGAFLQSVIPRDVKLKVRPETEPDTASPGPSHSQSQGPSGAAGPDQLDHRLESRLADPPRAFGDLLVPPPSPACKQGVVKEAGDTPTGFTAKAQQFLHFMGLQGFCFFPSIKSRNPSPRNKIQPPLSPSRNQELPEAGFLWEPGLWGCPRIPERPTTKTCLIARVVHWKGEGSIKGSDGKFRFRGTTILF